MIFLQTVYQTSKSHYYGDKIINGIYEYMSELSHIIYLLVSFWQVHHWMVFSFDSMVHWSTYSYMHSTWSQRACWPYLLYYSGKRSQNSKKHEFSECLFSTPKTAIACPIISLCLFLGLMKYIWASKWKLRNFWGNKSKLMCNQIAPLPLVSESMS